MSTAPFHAAVSERIDVSVEAYNGRPQVRIRDLRRGGWFVVGVGDLANLADELDRALTAICDEEARRR